METEKLVTFGVVDPKANVLLTVQRGKTAKEVVTHFDTETHGEMFVKKHRYSEVGKGALELPNLSVFAVYNLDKSGLDSSALTEDEGGAQVDDPAGTVRSHAPLEAVILREDKA